METKWEFIANRLKELGEKELSKMAKEIDDALNELYYVKTTKYWEEDYEYLTKLYKELDTKEEKMFLLLLIAKASEYCIACIVDEDCTECKLAERMNPCDDTKSTYYKIVLNLKAKSIERKDIVEAFGRVYRI